MSMTAYVNAHTHLYSALAPLGMPAPAREPENFVQILERIWWRLDRAIDADSLRAGARLYLAEALSHGTRGVIDHHESPNFIRGSLDILADVCQEMSMPAVLCYGATERNGGRTEARAGIEECRRFIRENDRPLVRGVIGLHAGFTVSDPTIREAVGVARELSTVLHLHVAEDMADVRDARERGYRGLIERLDQLGALIPGSILAHGVHLTEDEVRLCAERRCWLVQNPRSNRGNRVGYPKALYGSDRVALGTDGYPSDMEAELGALREMATAAGEADLHPEPVAARIGAGARLLAERMGEDGVFNDAIDNAAPPSPSRMEAIAAEAREQAALLWERMKAL
jgi:cytosine/adenosine deaminase-related metal-dependent hydrolase